MNFDSNFKLIREPLSGEGNALWLEDIGCLEESDVAILRHSFNSAVNYNRLTSLQTKPAIVAGSFSITRSKKSSKNKLDFYKCRLAEGFSGPGKLTGDISSSFDRCSHG